MRTTFTASPDVAEQIHAIAKRTDRSISSVVNELLRTAIWGESKSRNVQFIVSSRDMGLRPGIDPERLSALLVDLEATHVDRSGH